jgi:hypothetical protein
VLVPKVDRLIEAQQQQKADLEKRQAAEARRK